MQGLPEDVPDTGNAHPIPAAQAPSDTGDTQVSILANSEVDLGDLAILAGMEESDTGDTGKLQVGKKVHFFPGKRKLADGRTIKTGHLYWEWVYRDPETGKRKRPYGGTLETVPREYRYRISQYLERSAKLAGGSLGLITDEAFRFVLPEPADQDNS